MPEDEDLYDDDEQVETQPNPLNEAKKFERLLRKAEKAQAEADARAAKLEQELVVTKAGLQLTDRQLAALMKVHEGPWDVDSLKETAEGLGFVQQQQPEPEPEPDLSGYQRLQQAAGGGQEAGQTDWLQAIHNAKDEDEVLTIVERLGRTTTRTSQ